MIKIFLINLSLIILFVVFIFRIIIPIIREKRFNFLEIFGLTLITIGVIPLIIYLQNFIFPLIENYQYDRTLFDQLIEPTNKKISYLFESKFHIFITSIGFTSFFLILFGELLIISSKIDKSKEKK